MQQLVEKMSPGSTTVLAIISLINQTVDNNSKLDLQSTYFEMNLSTSKEFSHGKIELGKHQIGCLAGLMKIVFIHSPACQQIQWYIVCHDNV